MLRTSRLPFAPAGSRRLLDFWTRTRESGNPKVAPDSPADFVHKPRKTKAPTRRDRRQEKRLLDRFSGAPPARTPIQKSKKKKVSRDARAERSAYPDELPVASISNYHEQPTRQFVAPSVNHNSSGATNLRILSPKTFAATEFMPR
jgi:hypothetical protein